MQELDDIALLREYAERDSEPAFAALVTRHIDRVYSVALRHTRNPHQAEEITQAVFVILATKAKRLRKGVILEGWLYQTARLTALTFIRSEIRRARREQEAFMQNISNENDYEAWKQIAPLLDAALAGLSETDRNAVVLRFFYGKSMGEIGTALGANEDTARMRINRAIEKLQKFFLKHGVTSTAEAITGAISANSIQTAPAILAKAVTATAIAKGATASTSTLTLIEGALKVMTWTKTKTAIVAGIIVLLAAGTTTVTVKEIQKHRAYPWQTRQYDYSLLDNAKPQVAILPSRYGGNGGFGSSLGGVMGVGEPATSVIEAAYGWFNIPRIVVETKLPGGTYDFISSVPNRNALKDEVRKKFGVIANVETRETDVWLLQVKNSDAPNLKPASHSGQNHVTRGEIVLMNASLSQLAYLLENMMRDLPILDRTGSSNDDAPAAKPLQGNKPAIVRRQSPKETFDINLKWDDGKEGQPHNVENLKRALLDQLGLELVPGRENIEMLVVKKTN